MYLQMQFFRFGLLIICYNQYLNCKILHGGTLLQPWPNAIGMLKHFSGNYVFPFLKSSEDKKKKIFVGKFKVTVSEIE